MNIRASIKLKAAILFVVFASNTVLGFACAVGLDTDLLQRLIHRNEAGKATESLLFVHESGTNKQHLHEKKTSEKVDDCCNKKDDDCCNKKVVSFEQLDKTITQFITANFALPVCELPTFLLLNTTIYSDTSIILLNYIFRNLHSPPEDIRVSIRSFQI